MSSSILINIDMFQVLTIISTIVGCSCSAAWYMSGRFSRIDQRLIHVEKAIDEMKVDVREIRNLIK